MGGQRGNVWEKGEPLRDETTGGAKTHVGKLYPGVSFWKSTEISENLLVQIWVGTTQSAINEGAHTENAVNMIKCDQLQKPSHMMQA